MNNRVVHVPLGDRAYDIHVGQGVLNTIMDALPPSIAESKRFFVLTDENAEAYALQVAGACGGITMTLPPGEATKSIAWFERVQDWLLDNGVNRGSVLIAVGGGVVGDLAGFCAATIMRGISFVQVPTTLLAQVDSSVGGKTGINMRAGKNLVGAFHQPVAVFCDTNVLDTLPARELRAGYAEIVKYGLLGDAEFFAWLEHNGVRVLTRDPEAITHAVETSCKHKAEIVAEDEHERAGGRRALLNFGHTFAHAIESACGYDGRVLHGEAVAVGMMLATELSARLSLCSHDTVTRTRAHLQIVELPVTLRDMDLPLSLDEKGLLDRMRGDKKANDQGIQFILTRGIGQAFVQGGVDDHDVLSVLNQSL